MTESIALVGDSIFDNAVYVPNEPCVTEQLQAIVRDGVEVSMRAVDGNYVGDVQTQINGESAQTSHIGDTIRP